MTTGWWAASDPAPIAAVAIMRTTGCNTHVGIAHRLDDTTDALGLVHLAFHCKLDIEAIEKDASGEKWVAPSGLYLLLIPAIPSAILEAVATRCRSIARNRPQVKYGFAWAKDVYFDEHGHLFSKDDRGLNCSTFILTVFRSILVSLVMEDTWPYRPDDEQRFRDLLNQLHAYISRRFAGDSNELRYHEEYARRIAPDVTAIRIRPEETAAACFVNPLPADFARCEPLGRTVAQTMGIV